MEHAGELRALAPAWWSLLDRAAHPQPTQTPLWLLSWWSVFGGPGRELRVVVVKAPGGEVVGIVPLVRRRVTRAGFLPVLTLELLGSGEDKSDEIFSEYIGAIAATGYESAVAEAFADLLCAGELGEWDEMTMPAMSSEDPIVAHLVEALQGRSIEVELGTTHECPYVALPAKWEGYLSALDGHQRYFVRRTLRDLDAWAGPGGAVLRRADDEATLAEGFQILRSLHAERWQSAGAFGSSRFCRFHETVMPQLLRGSGGVLDLLWLEVRGAPIAVVYNIVYRGNVQFYQSGRTIDVPKHVRPGIALQLLAIRRAIEMGYRSYDFLAQASQYKHQLSTGQKRSLVTLSAIAPTLRAQASTRARRAARKLMTFARGLSRPPEVPVGTAS